MFSKITKIVEELQKKEFELFLQEIILIDTTKESEFLLKGMGIINIKENELYFKMYVKEQKKNFDDSFYNSAFVKNKEDGFNIFSALDSDGNKWEFKTSSFSEKHSFGTKSLSSIYGEIKSLSLSENIENKSTTDYLSFYFDLSYQFPLNEEEKIVEKVNDKLNSFYFKDKIGIHLNTIKIESSENDSSRTIKFTTKNQDQNFDIRILESLRFITGIDVSPYLLIRKTNGRKSLKIYGDLTLKNNIKFRAPLIVLKYKSPFANDSWVLFEKYLNYISSHKGAYYSELSSYLNAILGSSNSYLETKILVLCVRIEGIVNLLYPDYGNPNKQFYDEIDQLIEILKDNDLPDEIRKRVIPSIQMMKKSRIFDKLLAIKNDGIINDTQLSSWKTLRHKYAHSGNLSTKVNINGEIDKYNNILEMLYRLIFFAIGYYGNYTTAKRKESIFKIKQKSPNKAIEVNSPRGA